MSRIFQTEGVVIRRINYGEADRIVTLFTKRHGKLRAIAKGVRKLTSRRRGHLEVFNRVNVSVHQGRTMDSITDAVTVSGWYQPPGSLSALSHAYYACELVDRLLPEGEPYEDIYVRFTNDLRTLLHDPGTPECSRTVEEFALYLLRHLGFLPATRTLAGEDVPRYVESVIERSLRTPKLLKKLSRS